MATAATELGHAEREISTSELSRRLGETGLAVVDVRPLPRFNGWRGPARPVEAMSRAPSRSPPNGCRGSPTQTCSRCSTDKGIAASAEVVVYGDGEDVSLFHDRLAEHVSAPVRSLADGWPAWAPTSRFPVERLARHERLVHPEWLAELLAGGTPEAAPARKVPPLPRQLRRPRGVRRQPSPGRALPRHEPPREPARLEPPLAGGARRCAARARDHRRHDRDPLRARHRGRGEREVARPSRRPDRCDARGAHPLLQRRRGRPAARRRLRRLGAERPPARDRRSACPPRSVVRRGGPGPP